MESQAQVVVWNVDARNRPELEVEIEIECLPAEVPGRHLARLQPELEVEITIVDEFDAWFLEEDEVSDAYSMAI